MSLSNLITIISSNIKAMISGYKHGEIEKKSNYNYLNEIGRYSFWKNTVVSSVPEYRTYNHVHDFLDKCKIENGSAVAPNGKIRKVLFIGFDGMRADALPYVLDNASNSKTGVSGIAELQKEGGIYLAYCGGEAGTDTEQSTSTSACWTSHFTGVWGNKHGIITNDDSKNLQYKTFMLEYAQKGLNTSIAFDWDPYFDVNLREEIKFVMQNNLHMRFCDIDRMKKVGDEFNNFLSPDKPSTSAPYDTGMRDYVISRIEQGDDIVCGIFHNIDTAGHMYGFGTSTQYAGSVMNCDMYAHSILNVISEREKNLNEEWLVIFANDHGGLGKGHGNQTIEERTTWIATNIPFDQKYYARGYDGYNEK
ncbi:MAG: alkaline phosphatase family protein [Eubacterium sp.]